MLALCGSFAPSIVVDGIEREEDIRVALEAGAEWLQGCGVPLHDGAPARGPGGRA
jgi:EAL domain-containing protein (putative c-di-GMP-specific phosphodiesterase class I)